MREPPDVHELEEWLREGYSQSVRTAYLIMGNRLDAEDAVQEAFLRAWKFRCSLDAAASFKPWLYRVVVNTCNTRLRQEISHRDRRREHAELDAVAAIDDATGRVGLTNDVMRALSDLPGHLRIVVVLRYYADLSERDIAVVIDRKAGTVKSRLNEARRRLARHPALRGDAYDIPPDDHEEFA